MSKAKYVSITASLLLLFLFIASPLSDPTTQSVSINKTFEKLPLIFVANEGQADGHIQYLAHGSGATINLKSNGIDIEFTRSNSSGQFVRKNRTNQNEPITGHDRKKSIVQLTFVSANSNSRAVGIDKLAGKVNYLIGNNSKAWHTNISTYEKVLYHNFYSGIDMIYRGNRSGLEYDFILAPGADPSAIQFKVSGATNLQIDDNGNLIIQTPYGEIHQKRPFIYQQINETKKPIDGGYVLSGNNRIGYRIASYDKSQPIVIDPILAYSTYLGSTGFEQGNGIAVDASGSAYVIGITDDYIFVAKLNSTGSNLVYLNVIGGSTTTGAPISNVGSGIAVDTTGSAYLVGTTNATDFPTTAGAFKPSCSDPGFGTVFITKLNVTGSALVYSTYLCGGFNYETSTGGEEEGNAIAIDSAGNAYVTGRTVSRHFPTTSQAYQKIFGGAFDVFITKLNAQGSSLIYSTFLGGTGDDEGSGIAVDSLGNAYVTGTTSALSTNALDDFPTTKGAFQTTIANFSPLAFVTKINPNGSDLVYSTYLGGTDGFTEGLGIAVDSYGNAYVTGQNKASNFPTVNPIQVANNLTTAFGDAFVTKINPAGNGLVYSTLFTGSFFDWGRSIAVDSLGSAYVTGTTNSPDFLVVNAIQPTFGGNYDAFVDKLSPDGSALVYATFLGGSFNDEGHGIAVDAAGNAYVTGYATSPDFPTLSLLQPANAGGANFDGFVTKIANTSKSADLALTMTGSTNPIVPGNPVTYLITITNNGPDNSELTILNDVLPTWQSTSIQFSSATASQGRCLEMNGKVACDLGNLISGSSATVTIVVTSGVQSGLINSASVSSGSAADPDLSNNSASVTLASALKYALAVNKSGSGSGTVKSNPIGINCGSICNNTYINGASVMLMAIPDSGSTFSGWSGAGCSGTGSCSVTVSANVSIVASFEIVGGGASGSGNGNNGNGNFSATGGGCALVKIVDKNRANSHFFLVGIWFF